MSEIETGDTPGSIQLQIARALERHQRSVNEYVDSLSLEPAVLIPRRLWNDRLAAIFTRLDKLRAPTGLKSMFFYQSPAELAEAERLKEEAKGIVLRMVSERPDPAHEDSLRLLNAKMRALLEDVKSEVKNRRAPSAPAPAQRSTYHAPYLTSSPSHDSTLDWFLLQQLQSQNQNLQTDPQPIVSGQGGDFAGGGATATFVDCTQPITPDDLGACNFS